MDAAVPSATHRSTTVQPILVMAVVRLLSIRGMPLQEEGDLFELKTKTKILSSFTVVLAHVKRIVHDRSDWTRAYKVRIKKEFKVTESGRQALSYGRILTPSHDASCGIRLKPGRRYLLTGNIRSGKPWINLCNFVHDWDRMTPIQRKGFRRLYQRGCDCKVIISLAFSHLLLAIEL